MSTYKEKGNILLMLVILVAVAGGAVLLYPKYFPAKEAVVQENVVLQGADFDMPLVEIRVTSKGFEPAVITIKRGARVTWVNADKIAHNLISVENFGANKIDIDLDEVLESEDSLEIPFEQSGVFKYEDKDNPEGYQGVVTVE